MIKSGQFGTVIRVKNLQPGQTPGMPIFQGLAEFLPIKAQADRMGQDRGQAGFQEKGQAILGAQADLVHVSRAALSQIKIEGLLDAPTIAALQESPGKMGPAQLASAGYFL
jgi:hypothetical protein